MTLRAASLVCRSAQRDLALIAYSRPVSADHRTPAEVTAAVLRDVADGGLPIMIPGARETRTPAHADPVAVVTIRDHGDGLRDASRLEYEREGGGAPSERRNESAPFGRLRHWLFGSRY